MKHFLALSLLSSLLLTSCSVDWNDGKTTQNDLFEKKQECVKYENIVKEKYSNNETYFFDSIFYSEKYNSCLYRVSSKSLKNEPNHIIYDYLSNKKVISKNDICDYQDVNCLDEQKKFNEVLAK